MEEIMMPLLEGYLSSNSNLLNKKNTEGKSFSNVLFDLDGNYHSKRLLVNPSGKVNSNNRVNYASSAYKSYSDYNNFMGNMLGISMLSGGFGGGGGTMNALLGNLVMESLFRASCYSFRNNYKKLQSANASTLK